MQTCNCESKEKISQVKYIANEISVQLTSLSFHNSKYKLISATVAKLYFTLWSETLPLVCKFFNLRFLGNIRPYVVFFSHLHSVKMQVTISCLLILCSFPFLLQQETVTTAFIFSSSSSSSICSSFLSSSSPCQNSIRGGRGHYKVTLKSHTLKCHQLSKPQNSSKGLKKEKNKRREVVTL